MATRGRFRAINACEYRTRVRAGISLPVYKVRCSRKRQLFRSNIVSVPAFLSSLFVDCVYSFFFFVRFREIEIIFVIDNFELYGSIFFLLDMHFIDENITRLLIFIFQWILLIMSLVRFNACIIVIGLIIWIREFFNFFLIF